jgi:hypothetical protein
MARRDDLTYDVGPAARQRQVPWVSLLLLIAVLVLAVTLCVGLVRSSKPAPEAGPPPVAPVTVPATPPSSSPSASPMPTGSDAGDGLAMPAGSREATSRFVRAWLDRNPKSRAPALKEVTAPALAEQLMLTDPANIPRATPSGEPVLDEASTYSAQFTQALSNKTRITVYLVADPQARYRWLATSVQRA